MRKKNLKIQMLAGNSLKICLGASSQISTTLVSSFGDVLSVAICILNPPSLTFFRMLEGYKDWWFFCRRRPPVVQMVLLLSTHSVLSLSRHPSLRDDLTQRFGSLVKNHSKNHRKKYLMSVLRVPAHGAPLFAQNWNGTHDLWVPSTALYYSAMEPNLIIVRKCMF